LTALRAERGTRQIPGSGLCTVKPSTGTIAQRISAIPSRIPSTGHPTMKHSDSDTTAKQSTALMHEEQKPSAPLLRNTKKPTEMWLFWGKCHRCHRVSATPSSERHSYRLTVSGPPQSHRFEKANSYQ
jgi:hypothetical protein